MLTILFSFLLCIQKMNKYRRFEVALASGSRAGHRKESTRRHLTNWSLGTHILRMVDQFASFPALKQHGASSPLLPFPFACEILWRNCPGTLQTLLLEMHSPADSELLPATSRSIIPDSKILTRWSPLAVLLHAWKEFSIFLLDFNPALALDLIRKMRKS